LKFKNHKRTVRHQSNPLGVGLLFRLEDLDYIIKERVDVEWFEIVIEEIIGMKSNGWNARLDPRLLTLIDRYAVTLHGTELSIGSTDPLNWQYIKQVKNLIKTVKPKFLTDHLCWTGSEGVRVHELIPLPYTEEALNHVVQRINEVQDFLGVPIAFENPPNYITFKCSEMTEWEFASEIAIKSNSKILLDINNVFVSSQNNGYDPSDHINNIPRGLVQQIHLAGFVKDHDFFVDSHSEGVDPKVWKLYKQALQRFGQVSTSIEWDINLPSFEVVYAEVLKAKAIYNQI
jgi:uncharacterized protein